MNILNEYIRLQQIEVAVELVIAEANLFPKRSMAMAERRLVGELERLKTLTGLGYNLKVRWLPKANEKLSGEVKGEVIYIYEEDEVRALQILKHEFMDYCISQAIQPYKEVTNRLIALINDEAYQRKERLIEALAELLYKQAQGKRRAQGC